MTRRYRNGCRAAQKLETVAGGTTQNPAHDITCLAIRRNLTVDAETNRPDMVHDDTHRNAFFLRASFTCSRIPSPKIDVRAEKVGVVIALFALQRHAKAFEAHTRCPHFFARATIPMTCLPCG